MKKTIKKIIIALAAVILVIICSALCFLALYTPSLTADFSSDEGSITSNASGYLYGLAEQGVPSANMTESLDISTVSQKVPGGLQHPIGDLDHVYPQLDNTEYNVVYLQDVYSTWYYDHQNIERMRGDGTYDWQEYINDSFLPSVKDSVEFLSDAPYADKVVYCLYNECDNGLWFGETVEDDSDLGFWCNYNEQGAENFFSAWKQTYDLVKSLNPDALIGGPGFFEYNDEKISAFLSYCTKNNCVPDVMIYHELNDYSVYFWREHVRNYRQIEADLGIGELPIIVTEYGRMCDNGMPGKMIQYITQIEMTGVYGDQAYWRLADNLCDTCADDNTPNSNWWLYRWYADMDGKRITSSYQDLWNSNFENAYIKRKAEYTSQGFMGLVSMSESEDRIDIICGGTSGDTAVKLRKLDATSFGGALVKITVEEAVYKGLTGSETAPVTRSVSYETLGRNKTVRLENTDLANAYHIVIEKVEAEGEAYDFTDEGYLQRFEFENGTLLKNAYTYDSAYATSGELQGMVGGMENEGDGVSLTFTVPSDDVYNLDIIYGNANDGQFDKNGRQSSDGRTFAESYMTLDGNRTQIAFDNTIRSEYTDCYTLENVKLGKGRHTISFEHCSGTYVLDSLVVSSVDICEKSAVIYDGDRSQNGIISYLVSAAEDGYYSVLADESSVEKILVNGSEADFVNGGSYYLMRGLNYLDFYAPDGLKTPVIERSGAKGESYMLTAESAVLDGAKSVFDENNNAYYIDGISAEGGSASYKVNAEESGVYAFTVEYSNNDEGGVHDYNVDLIERYITIDVNGVSRDVFCRNTYSWDKVKTVTFYAQLEEGENEITLSNSGNFTFNGNETYAPHIYSVNVSGLSAD